MRGGGIFWNCDKSLTDHQSVVAADVSHKKGNLVCLII